MRRHKRRYVLERAQALTRAAARNEITRLHTACKNLSRLRRNATCSMRITNKRSDLTVDFRERFTVNEKRRCVNIKYNYINKRLRAKLYVRDTCDEIYYEIIEIKIFASIKCTS